MSRFRISTRYIIYAGILLSLASMAIAGSVLAKYADTIAKDDKNLTAKSFYFESDYLTEDDHLYKINSGTESIKFTLYNYENDLRVSETECTYTVSVETDDDAVTINGESTKNATITVDAVKTDTAVTLGGLDNGYEYTVTVTANAGYEKTLGAIFSVAPDKVGLFMNVNASNAEYVILTVWSENISGDVTVSVPAGLIPDTTDPIMKDITNYTDGEYTAFEFTDSESFAAVYSSHAYRFFKTDDYDADSAITVKMADVAAENKAN